MPLYIEVYFAGA